MRISREKINKLAHAAADSLADMEHVDFIDVEGGQGLNGTDVKFTVKVSGDTLTQTGNLGGTNMKEVWKRLP